MTAFEDWIELTNCQLKDIKLIGLTRPDWANYLLRKKIEEIKELEAMIRKELSEGK